MSLKYNLQFYAGLSQTRLDDSMHNLSNKSKYNLRHEAALISKDFKDLHVKLFSAKAINGDHIQKLISHWQQEKKYSTGTIENKITALKHILKAAGNPAKIPATNLGKRDILNQKNLDKSSAIVSEQNINNIKDLAAKSAIKLASAYGLRKEESIHIVQHLSLGQDVSKNNILAIKDSNGKGSLAKNGRPRDIKMHDNGKILLEVKKEILSQKLNLKSIKIEQFRNKIDNAIKGLKKITTGTGKITMHGFRHGYAQSRYFSITGLVAPTKGGLKFSDMNKQQQVKYISTSKIISQELGHNRVDITRTYVGK